MAMDDAEPAPVLRTGRVADHLAAWLADARVDDAATARRRQWWLQRQAEEAASLAGVMVDLAERARPVVVTDRTGRRHRGSVTLVGTDVLVLETGRADVVVPLDAVAAVQADPGTRAAVGDREVQADADLATVVAVLAGDRPRVTVGLTGGEVVSGELRSCGRDVVRVVADGGGRESTYVPLRALAHLSVLG